jgi:nitrogen fixation NifU-like protein
MSEQNPLYQDIILDYYEFPRNRGRVDGADATCRGHNPSCGDDLTVSVKVVDGTIGSVMWDGHACAISEASASMMTEAVLDTPTESARAWVRTSQTPRLTWATPMPCAS